MVIFMGVHIVNSTCVLFSCYFVNLSLIWAEGFGFLSIGRMSFRKNMQNSKVTMLLLLHLFQCKFHWILYLWEVQNKAQIHHHLSLYHLVFPFPLTSLSKHQSTLTLSITVQKCYKSFQKVWQNMCMCYCWLVTHLGWIEAAYDPSKSISFLKLESNEAGDFRLVLSLKEPRKFLSLMFLLTLKNFLISQNL